MPTTFKVEVGDESRRSRVLSGTEDNVNEDRVIDVPMDYKPEFELDTDAAVRDFAGIPVLAIRPFIVRREKIIDMFKRGEEVERSIRSRSWTSRWWTRKSTDCFRRIWSMRKSS